MFEYETSIKIHEIDAAGIMFFGNYFKLANDAIEAFMESRGMSIKTLLEQTGFLLPVARASMDYKTSLRVGDKAVVKLNVKKIGTTSLTLSYEIYKEGEILVATGETVHVSIDRNTGQKIPLPLELVEIL